MTTEEKEAIRQKIKDLTNIKNQLKNEEQGIKLTMNSIYGATGNNFFVCFNPEVAESVTSQGQDLIKYSEKVLHKYFHEYWHLDKELHEKLGLTRVKPVTQPLVIYGDTDSNYVTFEEVVKSCDYKGGPKELVLKINEYRLNEYLKNCFNLYAKNNKTENHQDFELETLAKTGIFLAKKKYVVDLVYDSGVHFEPLSNLKITGIEMIKGGTAPFVRETLTNLTKIILKHGKNFDLIKFVSLLKDIKKDFKLQEPNNIAISIQVNHYDKYILNDTTALEVGKKCPIHIKAGGYYNYILNNNPKYKEKYSLIKSGEKINYYYINTDSVNNVFGYLQGSYPYEFAPAMDFDIQFNKSILDPINRFIVIMGFNQISQNLFTINSLF